MSAVAYYTKVKRLWDELLCLSPISPCCCNGCNCGATKIMTDLMFSNHIIKFLIGLHVRFDYIRNQILVMEPLPTANKTYSLILRIYDTNGVSYNY